MYDTILLPTDGSAGAERAVDVAVDLVTTFDAELHTLYVVDTNVGDDLSVGDLFDELETTGERAIESVVDRADAAGVGSVEGSLGRGAPAQVILDYVDTHDVDLVVMGTHGRTGLDRYLLGSVTERVLRLAPVPVLTVSLPDTADDD